MLSPSIGPQNYCGTLMSLKDGTVALKDGKGRYPTTTLSIPEVLSAFYIKVVICLHLLFQTHDFECV